MRQNITNMMSTKSNRIEYIDLASGIMILWMIVAHAISAAWGYELVGLWSTNDPTSLPDGIHAFINSEGKLEAINPCVVYPWLHFFMPWFFYKSGQFFTKRSVKELWKKDWNKLLKTFVIWSAVGYVFFLFLGWLTDSLTLRSATYSIIRGLFLRGYIPINNALWFLLTLFGVRMVANWLLPERENRFYWLRVIGVVLLGYAVSYLAFEYNHHLLPWWVANGAAGLSFFVLGYALRDWEYKWWLVLPCAIVYVAGCICGFPIVGMLDNDLEMGNYLLWIPVALCCIVAFDALCRWICQHMRVRPIEWVGKNAMTIYVTHYLICTVISTIFSYLVDVRISVIGLFAVIIAGYILILPLCWKLMNSKFYKKI